MKKTLDTFIQWKVTDLCMDWLCAHGHSNHIDGTFCYEVTCDTCGEIYELSTQVSLKKLESMKKLTK